MTKRIIKLIIIILIIAIIVIGVVIVLNKIQVQKQYEIWNEYAPQTIVVTQEDKNKNSASWAAGMFQYYVKQQNTTALLAVLDSDFITNNGLTGSNVLSKLTAYYNNVDMFYTYITVEEYPNNLSIAKVCDLYDTSKVYYIIVLNRSSNIFSIIPCAEGKAAPAPNVQNMYQNIYNRILI